MRFLFTVAAALAVAQGRIEFEVASIRPSTNQSAGLIAGSELYATAIEVSPRQVRLTRTSLLECIAFAFRLDPGRVVGPEWLTSVRFDIVAALPDGATRAQVPDMLQTLLAARFGIRAHREQRELPVYVLEAASVTLQLERAAPDSEASGDPSVITTVGNTKGLRVTLPRGGSYALLPDRFEARKVTPVMLVEALSRFAGRPVVDRTGVDAHFDIAFDISPGEFKSMLIRFGAAHGEPVPPDALQWAMGVPMPSTAVALRRAGLSLAEGRLPIEVLVVDAIQRVPTEN